MDDLHRHWRLLLATVVLVVGNRDAIGLGRDIVVPRDGQEMASSDLFIDTKLSLAGKVDSLELAEENKVVLKFENCPSPKATISWAKYSRFGGLLYDGREGVSGETNLTVESPEGGVIHVTPLRSGRLQLSVHLSCGRKIGGKLDIDVHVSPPKIAPEAFFAGDAWPTPHKVGVASVELGERSEKVVEYYAKYSKSPQSAVIAGHAINFHVFNPKGSQSVIEVDRETGNIRGLAVGHALLEADFEGVRDFTCVNVVLPLSPAQPGADCAELLPTSEAPLRRKFEGKLRGASGAQSDRKPK